MNYAPRDGVVRTDVIVVGAGFCGLSAAHALMEKGIDFVLLEARQRVGGRVESMTNGLGERIDTGGQYFCQDMPEISALARRYGKTVVDALVPGRTLVEPAMMEVAAGDLYRRFVAIRDRARALDPNDPAITALSVRAWTDEQPEGWDARQAFRCSIEGLWCQPTNLLPLWYLVSNDRRITNRVSELQYFLKETMHALADDLARDMGSRLRLGEATRRVKHGPRLVSVETGTGIYEAEHAIIAVPPATARRLSYDPPVPVDLCQALSAWKSGKVIKGLVRYPRRFWRERDLSGSIFFLDPVGLYVCDASRGDAEAALVVFAGGRLAESWHRLGETATRSAILDRLRIALGPEAAAPLDILLRDWTNDAVSGGGYSDTILDFSARDAEDVLRRGLLRVSFASSELSPSFPGYIEGAIIAGRAAANRIAAQSAIATSASGS